MSSVMIHARGEPATRGLTLALTPTGHLLLAEAAEDGVPLPANMTPSVVQAWGSGWAQGLLHLGWVEAHAVLPPVFAFWRDLARAVVSGVCTTPGVEDLRDRVELPAADEALEQSVRSAPPMAGGEYLSVPVLQRLRTEVLEALRTEIRQAPGQTVQQLLAARNVAWHVVGRVHFHLAENRRDPERPFAFLASYTTGLYLEVPAEQSGSFFLRLFDGAVKLKAR